MKPGETGIYHQQICHFEQSELEVEDDCEVMVRTSSESALIVRMNVLPLRQGTWRLVLEFIYGHRQPASPQGQGHRNNLSLEGHALCMLHNLCRAAANPTVI